MGDNLREIKPHFIPVVPRLPEKIYDKIVDRGSNLKGIKRMLFFWSLNLGKKNTNLIKKMAMVSFSVQYCQ
ncbi:MAG: hypothetical protein WA143_09280 [Lutibacter sp.]